MSPWNSDLSFRGRECHLVTTVTLINCSTYLTNLLTLLTTARSLITARVSLPFSPFLGHGQREGGEVLAQGWVGHSPPNCEAALFRRL